MQAGFAVIAAASMPFLVSGCASVSGSAAQAVTIQTIDGSGKTVSGALCELANDKGRWSVTTPGSTTIVKSNEDLQVACSMVGQEVGRATIGAAAKDIVGGNMLLGGIVGAMIDHKSGAAYEYQPTIQVVMGRSIKIEPENRASDSTYVSNPAFGAPQRTGTVTPEPARVVPTNTTRTEPTTTKTTEASRVQSTEERLQELKRLREAGLISEQIYIEQQRRVLETK